MKDRIGHRITRREWYNFNEDYEVHGFDLTYFIENKEYFTFEYTMEDDDKGNCICDSIYLRYMEDKTQKIYKKDIVKLTPLKAIEFLINYIGKNGKYLGSVVKTKILEIAATKGQMVSLEF